MMNVCIVIGQLIQDVLGVSFLTLIFSGALQCAERKRSTTVIAFTGTAALSLSVSAVLLLSPVSQRLDFEDAVTVLGFLSCLLVAGMPQVILKIEKRLRITLLSLAMMAMVEMVFGLYNIVANVSAATPKGYFVEQTVIACVYLLGCIVFRLGTRNRELTTVKNVVNTMPRWIFALAVFLSFAAYCMNGLNDGGEYAAVFQTAKNVVFVCAVIWVLFCAGYFIYKIFSLSYQQTLVLKQLDEQHQHYETMLKSDEQLRQFRHDYKNHMLVVTALLNSGNTEAAADYLDKIKIMSGVAGRQFSTGNFVADAILNNKNMLAEEYAIHMECIGSIPESGIENSDLCTVLANFIDNAIEGTKHYPGERYIRLEAFVRNGFLTLSVTNPVSQRVQIKSNRIVTTKADSKNHGIGLKNAEKTAKAYQGKMSLKCTDTEFCADVMLKLHLNEEES